MQILVLGAAAGGGSPQWNCNCSVCDQVRQGAPGTVPRTQASLAVRAQGHDWAIFNAAPDLRQQLNEQPLLHPDPARGLRHSPIGAVVVTNADIDHIAGLLNLREGQPFALYGGERILQTLDESPVFGVLNPEVVPRRTLVLDTPTELAGADGQSLGLTVAAFAVPGKVALYQETAESLAQMGKTTADTLGLDIRTVGQPHRLLFISSCAAMTPDLAARIEGATVLFFDGTLWADDELVRPGLTAKTGQRMGHMSMDGPAGSIAQLAPVQIERRVFIHINNSNPVLLGQSPERAAAEAAGWEIAYDGMQICL